MSKENLVVCFRQGVVEDYLIREMQDAWPEVDVINVGQKDLAAALLEADYFCGHAKVPVDWDQIVASGRLKWIQSSAAGMDWCLVPSVIESDIEITTASGALADQVAEHTMGLLLASLRSLPAFFSDQYGKSQEFHSQNDQNVLESSKFRQFVRLPTKDLTGATVGIIGFGGVGRRLSQVLAPWKVKILATDLFPQHKPDHVAELWPPDRIDELLSQSDIIVLSLPLNQTTRYYLDEEKFRKIKPGALLANVARGPLLKTSLLIEALKSGALSAAVLDVTDPEPLPKEHELWDAPNLIITPHVAGQAAWRFEMIVKLFVENVKRRKSGQALINRLSSEGKRLGFPLRNGETPLWIDQVEKTT